MAVTLGKRKRHLDSVASATRTRSRLPQLSASDEDDDRARQLFQRAFEAKFRPLETSSPSTREAEISSDEPDHNDDDAEDEEDRSDDWSGLSDDDSDQDVDENNGNLKTIEVVEFSGKTSRPSAEEVRRARKGFMSSKPPSSSDDPRALNPATRAVTNTNAATSEDGSEATNLKHDLALQRLLKESHLLDPASFSSDSLEPQGAARLRALDLRIRDLGAKKSILAQERMPMAHRKGILAKAAEREATRRREAADNGIVLEKKSRKGASAFASASASASSSAASVRKRVRGVGGPTVGKFRGGTLTLSTRDVRSIEGQNERRGSGKKGRRR